MLAILDGRPVDELEETSRRALAQVPFAARWARRFTNGFASSPKGFRKQAAPSTVRYAVDGIAKACIPDPDTMLRDLLVGAIDDCAAYRRPTGAASESQPAARR
jgi:hypothetical protein